MSTASNVWRRLNHGVLGYVFYIVLGMAAALAVTNVLGLALDTSVPLVAVLSGSMDHGVNEEGHPCGKEIAAFTESFDNWWNSCFFTYEEFEIGQEKFSEFPFSGGLKKGDIPVIRNDGIFGVGDIIVYDTPSQRVPIIHRVVKVNEDGTLQTKGDHNSGQNSYEKSVQISQVRGKVIFVVPYLGYLRVLLPIN